ncbi:MAG TPA: enolase C-terminal domain-like protein [Thermomicrobiales bacterium]|nr:enolase C-terminal domain-like protein [Thermomicrobiales bacterium]
MIPIRAPREEAVRSGTGAAPVTASEFGIVRIVADDGCEGVGEISITAPRIGFSLCYAARNLIAPRLIGLDPLRRTEVLEVVDAALMGELSAPYLRAAFEMALLDLAGRHFRVTVYELLGGRARDAVPLAWGIYQKAAEQMAADAVAAVEAGFQAIKLKVGRQLEEDVAAVRAVSRAFDHAVPLRLDANMAWRSVAEAGRAIAVLAAEAPVAWVEQPLGRDNLEGLRLLRQRAAAPIMTDESLQTLRDAYAVARAEAADVWNVYVVEAGGLVAAAHIFALAATVDVPCIIGSQAELGIGTAAAAHLGVAMPNLPYPCETFGPLRYERDVVGVGTRIERGLLTPADGPGLGVELDWDVIGAWRVDLGEAAQGPSPITAR